MLFCQFLTTGRALIASCAIAIAVSGCFSPSGIGDPPYTLAVDALANGIAVRPKDGDLFVTDDTTNAILAEHDGREFSSFGTVPVVAGQSNGLSQVTLTPDGSEVLVARFGFGTAGAVFGVSGADSSSPWMGIDPNRRRLGLVSLGGGRALSTWFEKHGSTPPAGGLSLLTYDKATHAATERDLLTGLDKPVGVVVSGSTVIVSEQGANTVVSANLDALLSSAQPTNKVTILARVTGPDLLAIDDRGTVYTKCNKTGVCSIAKDGTVMELANDLRNARGIAVDTMRHILYVVDRSRAPGQASYIRSFPIK